MITAGVVINSVTSMLHKPNLKRKASLSLSRILTQLDMRDLPYDEGVNTSCQSR